MVSLGHNFNMNTGAQHMNENIASGEGAAIVGGSSLDNELEPVLSSNDENSSFKPLKTIPTFGIHLFISTVISLIGVVLAATWPPEKRCEAYFVMIYLRATFWVITLVFDHIVKKQHDDLRMNGYHDFNRATAMHKSLPLYVVSLWNTALLAVQALIHHYYGEKFWEHCAAGFLSPVSYVCTFNIAETVVLSLIHSFYIAKVHKFNKAAPAPDALRGANNASGSLGLMQPGGNTADLLEKQADLIAYLQDHNLKLNQKLHQMQLHARTINVTP